MIGLRRRGLAVASVAVLTAGMLGVAPVTSAGAAPGTPFSKVSFFSYNTGSQVHTDAITNGTGSVLAVEQAFSGTTSANDASKTPAGGLTGIVNDSDTGALVQPASADGFHAYGRGTGLEVGLGTSSPVANQILLPGLSEAKAPPSQQVGPKHLLPLNLPGIANGAVLNSQAAANFSGSFCPVGQPVAFGEGDASNVGLLGTTPGNSLVSTAGTASPAATGFSKSRTDLVANPVIPGVSVADGTFGLVSTVQEHIAPISINLVPNPLGGPALTALQIAVGANGINNPVTLQTAVDGQGHTKTTLVDDDLITIKLVNAGIPTTLVSQNLNTILGPNGLVVDTNTIPALGGPGGILTLLNTRIVLTVAAPPKPIPGFASNAGAASATLDIVKLAVTVLGVKLVGLNVGHMQTAVALSGSISCEIPVAKNANPTSVTAGGSFTWNISIPSSIAALADSTCDLTNIMATDTIKVNSGTPKFTITSINKGGQYNPATGTITWPNLGTYHVASPNSPADPPIVLTVTVAVPSDSPAGVLEDTAHVTAGLGNCKGGATGEASLVGAVGNAIASGSVRYIGPQVAAGNGGNNLAATGNGPILAWAGALLLIMAAGTRRILRRARPDQLS